MNHTNGPWVWRYRQGEGFSLCTPDRGMLIVMDFVRMGMNRAQPRFARWQGEERARFGGIMHKAEDLGELHDHPDARLIAYAPEVFEALKAMVEASPCQNGCAPDDMTCATRKAERVIASVENKAKVN